MSRLPVSALLITRDEEKVLARALGSLTWADEILVVDAESSDRTRAIAEAPGAEWAARLRFLSRPWPGFRAQRTFALEQAAHDWVLVLDADEACSLELGKRVQELLARPDGPPERAYKVRRVEYFLGKEIRHGVWNPSYQDRFFHREGVRYVNDIHEYPVFPKPPGVLEEPIHHWPHFGPERFLEKLNRYTSIEARDRVAAGQRTNLVHLLGAGPAMFLKNYFYYRAWRDGIHGVIISLLEGVSRTVRHIKLWQYARELKRDA